MARCNKCRYGHDCPMSCKDSEKNFPFCGFKQMTAEQVKFRKQTVENKLKQKGEFKSDDNV